jgi:hypothetical protein
MSIGMLWLLNKNSTMTLAQKIAQAAAYYLKKYGRAPELCLVNPSMLDGQTLDDVPGITVRPWRPVLPGHMWIGIEEMPTKDEVAQ